MSVVGNRFKELVKGCACNMTRKRIDERVARVLDSAEAVVRLHESLPDHPLSREMRDLHHNLEVLSAAITREGWNNGSKKA